MLTVILSASLRFADACITAGYGKSALKLAVAYDLYTLDDIDVSL